MKPLIFSCFLISSFSPLYSASINWSAGATTLNGSCTDQSTVAGAPTSYFQITHPHFTQERRDPQYLCSSTAQVLVSTSVTLGLGSLLSDHSGFQAQRQRSNNSDLNSFDPGFSRITYLVEPGATINIQTSASSGGEYGGQGRASAHASISTNIVSTTDTDGNHVAVNVSADAALGDWQPYKLNIMPFSAWMVGFSDLATDAVEGDDTDGVGWSNFQEYLNQTSPNRSQLEVNSYIRIREHWAYNYAYQET
ncbi:MAG: hypothetical protein ACSHX0_00900 [Akkermansiaceae bacterium]